MLPSLSTHPHTRIGCFHVSQRGNGPPQHRQPHTLQLCPTGNLTPVIRLPPAPLLQPSLLVDDLIARVPWARVSAKGGLSSLSQLQGVHPTYSAPLGVPAWWADHRWTPCSPVLAPAGVKESPMMCYELLAILDIEVRTVTLVAYNVVGPPGEEHLSMLGIAPGYKRILVKSNCCWSSRLTSADTELWSGQSQLRFRRIYFLLLVDVAIADLGQRASSCSSGRPTYHSLCGGLSWRLSSTKWIFQGWVESSRANSRGSDSLARRARSSNGVYPQAVGTSALVMILSCLCDLMLLRHDCHR